MLMNIIPVAAELPGVGHSVRKRLVFYKVNFIACPLEFRRYAPGSFECGDSESDQSRRYIDILESPAHRVLPPYRRQSQKLLHFEGT